MRVVRGTGALGICWHFGDYRLLVVGAEGIGLLRLPSFKDKGDAEEAESEKGMQYKAEMVYGIGDMHKFRSHSRVHLRLNGFKLMFRLTWRIRLRLRLIA
eukprot:scaffold10012_cov87-Skeletonema_dohrnii-CCMP3373.AAC.4